MGSARAGHPVAQCCILTCHQENARSSWGRAPPHQQNTQHPHGSHISIHPCPPWCCPMPCSGAGTQGKAGDWNTKEQRQSPEEETCPAHAAHRNLHKHPENTTEAPALTRTDRSGSRRLGRTVPLPGTVQEQEPSTAGGVGTASCTPWLPVVPCPRESPHHSLLLGPLGPRGAVVAISWGHCLQEQPGVKETSWSLFEIAF